MSPLKVALGVLWLAALAVMWSYRAEVVAAYAEEREPVDLQLATLDLAVRSSALADSPYDLRIAPDTRSVPLPFLGDPEPTRGPQIQIRGGEAELSGSVLLDGQPVPDAIVRITRITAGGRAEIDLATKPDGTWSLSGLLGGRFRVRAFIPHQLASANSSVVFISEGAKQVISLQVSEPTADTIFGLAGPEEILVGGQATVGLTVGLRQVDAAGRIVVDPVPGAVVSALIGPPVELLSANIVSADGQGAATFQVLCTDVGTAAVTADVNGLVGVLTLPPCVAPPPLEPDPEPVEGG